MKHFIIRVEYKVALEKIDEILAEHRAFLQIGYDQGWLLCSGPQNPRSGGLIVARAPSEDELRAFFARDPYQKHNAADYVYTEFTPVKFQPFFEDWVKGG